MNNNLTSDNTNKAFAFGRYFEEFNKGDIYSHTLGKTITESDNNLFSLITMNHHPVHLDTCYAQKGQHKKILVVGTLVFSLIVGLTVRDISGKAIANLCYEDIKHHGPVFINDTLYAESEVLDTRASKSKSDRGIVYIETRGYKVNSSTSDKVLVISYRRKVLIPKRPDMDA